MTASDVGEKDERAAEEFCLQMGALIRERTDGKPVRLENLRAIAEVNAKAGFFAGIQHAHSEQAQLVEALEDAIEGMATMVDDLNHCFEERCVPIEGEVVSARAHLKQAHEALAGWRKK
jgi:hypothetical protein